VGINFSPPEIFINDTFSVVFSSALGYYISISKMCIKNTWHAEICTLNDYTFFIATCQGLFYLNSCNPAQWAKFSQDTGFHKLEKSR
jgi:hypothetical protein